MIDTCGFKDTGSTSDDDIVHMIRNAIQQHCKQIHMVLIVCSLGRYGLHEGSTSSFTAQVHRGGGGRDAARDELPWR